MPALRLFAAVAWAAAAAASSCSFCSLNGQGQAVTFDLSVLGNASYDGNGYEMTTPCGQVRSPTCGWISDPASQGCKGIGTLANVSMSLVAGGAGGFNLTLHGGFDDPPMPNGRNAQYIFICDTTVPASNPPMFNNVSESPPGFYNIVWRTPAACGVPSGSVCGPSPPVPPPAPPPTPCMPGSDTCLPTWTPSWEMEQSTVLYTCNNSGFHNVTTASRYWITVYDWSNAKVRRRLRWREGGRRGKTDNGEGDARACAALSLLFFLSLARSAVRALPLRMCRRSGPTRIR